MSENNLIKAFGDCKDDGMIHLSFTLPLPESEQAREAARCYAAQMGLERITVAHMKTISEGATYFVVFAQNPRTLDLDQVVVVEKAHTEMNFNEVNAALSAQVGRKIIVLGACLGSDAHTVGIDAIFNMKGYNHDWGFERYPMMSAHNLRAQVDVVDLAKKVVEMKADAVLVSRVVTQRDEHIVELKKFLASLSEQKGAPSHLLKICGGPRITHKEALEWGYDAGFGPGTKPSQVASFIAHALIERGVH